MFFFYLVKDKRQVKGGFAMGHLVIFTTFFRGCWKPVGFKPNSFKGWNGTFFIYSFLLFFKTLHFRWRKHILSKQHKTLEDWKIPIFCRTVGDTSSFMVQFCSQLCWFSGVFLSETHRKILDSWGGSTWNWDMRGDPSGGTGGMGRLAWCSF